MKSEIYFSSSAPNPMSTTMKLIHFEKIDFDKTVGVTSNKLELVTWCQKTFYTDVLMYSKYKYSLCWEYW